MRHSMTKHDHFHSETMGFPYVDPAVSLIPATNPYMFDEFVQSPRWIVRIILCMICTQRFAQVFGMQDGQFIHSTARVTKKSP